MANQLNSITFAGYLVEDAKVVGDNTVAFKVAQNQYDPKGDNQSHTNWFQCYWYLKDPSKVTLSKGGLVTVSGELKATLKDAKYMNLNVRVNAVVLPPKSASDKSSDAPKEDKLDDDIPF
tara:strand:+ start:1245 stop:1604 length:360 start_codon:yes stop_codon:yes gene_type:complete